MLRTLYIILYSDTYRNRTSTWVLLSYDSQAHRTWDQVICLPAPHLSFRSSGDVREVIRIFERIFSHRKRREKCNFQLERLKHNAPLFSYVFAEIVFTLVISVSVTIPNLFLCCDLSYLICLWHIMYYQSV